MPGILSFQKRLFSVDSLWAQLYRLRSSFAEHLPPEVSSQVLCASTMSLTPGEQPPGPTTPSLLEGEWCQPRLHVGRGSQWPGSITARASRGCFHPAAITTFRPGGADTTRTLHLQVIMEVTPTVTPSHRWGLPHQHVAGTCPC